MVHAPYIKQVKIKEKEKKSKRARIGSFNFSQQRPDNGNHSQFQNNSLSPSLSSEIASLPKFRKDN